MMYEVVGFERRKGDKSKKTGKPYDLKVFHCIDKVPYTKSEDFAGNKVEQVVFNLLNCTEDVRQKVLDVDIGSNINVYYNRSGFADGLDIVTI